MINNYNNTTYHISEHGKWYIENNEFVFHSLKGGKYKLEYKNENDYTK